jgi:hypothetical protein
VFSTSSLAGVSARSATNAWAVGGSILHWNGTGWRTAAEGPSGFGGYTGVAARSTINAWAVGYNTDSQRVNHTVTKHWNGTNWSRVASP